MATLLVADDDQGVRYALVLLLRAVGGYEVMEADGCGPALQIMAETKPDVVVTEAVMAGMTAVEYIEQMRRACPSAGIVAISAGSMHQDPVFATGLASMAGADTVLRKPARNEALLAAVSELLSR